jgi:hypothetical protein
MAIFSKPTVRIHFNSRIRTIVILTGGKLIGIYFLYLLSIFTFCNLLSVMMHLRQGKNVSILPLGDVNSGLIASRRGLLEEEPIVR